MGIFDRLERSIERGVNGVFAKAFRSEVQPVEIASAMRRAMDDRAVSAGKGKRHVVPNLFVVELSTTDYEGLVTDHEDELADELIATASEHAESQRYQPGGPVSVQFSEDESLETGVFRLRPSNARQVQPNMRRMPERMPPARDVDDPRAPRGHEPPPAAYRDPAPGLDTGSAGAPPYSTREGGRPSAPPYSTRNEGRPSAPARPTRKPDDYRPSPAAPRKLRQRPWLDVDGDRYPLLGSITVIGRDDDADILLDDPGISRRHSEIRITYDGPHQVITIRDLGSTNGTFVNGDPVGTTHLSEGDRITVGRTHLIVHEGGTR
ncbi:MAG TPA: FhaA domain-containing protein [Flexivirga sp.]|uniref:FhaA domain-containing protein n=1 Tax=Flexivirga sp. TaxID=1962927 RepID=UPI002C8A0032|nr:FhaA domain-containing protein [Flexivirga sp.]HWC22963.1 FhaA domain-containing protein [Flexivirga sp.]